MKINHLVIHNFRGIVDAQFRLFDYSLLVGPNNAGKSTVIDAIRAFYEKDGFKYKHDRDFPFIGAADKESWIDITFDLTDAEYASLAEDYKWKDNTLRLRKFFKSDDKNKEGIIFGFKANESLSDEAFYGAKNVQSGKIGDVIYIPAVSKLDDLTKFSGPSPLRDLISTVLEAVVESSASYEKFSADFDDFASKIKHEATADGRSLDRLETELTEALRSWDTEFHLNIRSPSTAEIIKTLVEYNCLDKTHGRALSGDCFGSGFQRHFIFTLIQVGARYAVKKAIKKTKDFSPSMALILFEEPEAFLHPPQQELLVDSLLTLSGQPDRQVLCSTHSPHFVSRNTARIPSIMRMKRQQGRVEACQVEETQWQNIVDSNQLVNVIANKYPKLKKTLAADDLRPEMEAVKYCLWLDPDRCGMFFANHVLLVEGPTEQALIGALLGDGAIKRPLDGLYVLDCIGKFNMHRFMNLLAGLGIPHSVLHDDDKSADHHADFNKLIQDTRRPNLTTAVQALPGDLESFLGVTPAGSPHRKPQHVLFLLGEKKIDDAKLSAFCSLVQGCIPSAPVKDVKVTTAPEAPRS